jgi:hypothetical protein
MYADASSCCAEFGREFVVVNSWHRLPDCNTSIDVCPIEPAAVRYRFDSSLFWYYCQSCFFSRCSGADQLSLSLHMFFSPFWFFHVSCKPCAVFSLLTAISCTLVYLWDCLVYVVLFCCFFALWATSSFCCLPSVIKAVFGLNTAYVRTTWGKLLQDPGSV